MDNQELVLSLKTELSIPLNGDEKAERIRSVLGKYINELIENNFDQLVHLLYRVDVNENKLKATLKDNSNEDAGLIIADLIIERQLQRIAARKNFKSSSGEIDEKEKW